MKFFSRKLLVLIMASIFVWFGKIDGWQWLMMASAYMGMNVLDKIVGIKDAKNRPEEKGE